MKSRSRTDRVRDLQTQMLNVSLRECEHWPRAVFGVLYHLSVPVSLPNYL